LPGAYIEAAQFDCLHDEGLEYAEKLRKSGTEVMVSDTLPGTRAGLAGDIPALLLPRKRRFDTTCFRKALIRTGKTP
jgi:acetyl esterase/lipase